MLAEYKLPGGRGMRGLAAGPGGQVAATHVGPDSSAQLTIAGVDTAPRTIQVASGTKAIGNPTWIGDTVLVPLLFFGQHRGFAPPRPDRDFNPNAPFNAVRPERSLETEAGVRARLPGRGSVQAVLYDLKLDDLIVEGPLVGGRSGGVGFAAAYSWLYEATLRSDVDLGASGVRGKRVPYAPVHQFDIAMDVGLGRDLFLEVGVNFLDEQFATADNVRAGSADGMSGLIPARRLWRATLRHEPAGSALRLHLSAQNLFDSKYVASRVDGLFAGMPRLVTAGVEYRF